MSVACVNTVSSVLAALLALPLGGPAKSAEGKIDVRVDPRVELMSIIFRLAGHPEYNTAPNYPYLEDVESHFRKFENHAVVQAARDLRRQHGVSYDAVASMALHLTDAYELKERIPLDRPPKKLDGRWNQGGTRDFLKKARQFVQDSNFKKFVEDHQQLYEETADVLGKRVSERDYIAWFDEFFGARPTAKFFAIAGMLNGPGNYGPSVVFPDGSEEIYMVIGVGRVGAGGKPHFGGDLVGLVVHEYCHSYVNHVVDKHMDQLMAAGDKLFPQVQQAMKRQAYGSWQTVMRESAVRACTVRYLLKTDGEQAAKRATFVEHARSFLWTGELVEVLAEYESNREKYPTFDSFFPRVVEFFNDYAARHTGAGADGHADGGKLARDDLYGPINDILAIIQRSPGSAVVRPDAIKDDDLSYRVKNFVKSIHQQFFAAKGVKLVTATEADEKKLHDKPLVLYGSPKSNALLKDMLKKCGIKLLRNKITIGERVFKGKGLVLITCYPNPYNPKVPILIYASADDENVLNLNDFFHGPTDYLVGRWTKTRKPETLHQGNYHKTSDGKWEVPE